MPLDFKLIELLKCPVDSSDLSENTDSVVSVGGEKYSKVNDKPVLVNFDESILDKDIILKSEGSSQIDRSNLPIVRKLKDGLFHNKVIKEIEEKSRVFIKEITKQVDRPKVLIIGGGTRGMGTKPLFDSTEIDIISFDIYYSENIDFIADAHNIPIKDEVFDGIWIQYVLEHVLEPWIVVQEIHRILKQNGIVYSETPFLQQVHEGRYDFTRFTHSGHRWLFKNFTEIQSGTSMGTGLNILWTIDYASRSFFRNSRLGKLFKLLFFWVRFIDLFVPKSFQYDSASSFYFIGSKSKISLSPKDIINYYRGKDKLPKRAS